VLANVGCDLPRTYEFFFSRLGRMARPGAGYAWHAVARDLGEFLDVYGMCWALGAKNALASLLDTPPLPEASAGSQIGTGRV